MGETSERGKERKYGTFIGPMTGELLQDSLCVALDGQVYNCV